MQHSKSTADSVVVWGKLDPLFYQRISIWDDHALNHSHHDHVKKKRPRGISGVCVPALVVGSFNRMQYVN